MIKFWAFWVFAVHVAISACYAADTGAASAERPGQGAPAQILVMLHLPAPHFRPDNSYSGRYTDDSGRSARRRIAEDLARVHGLTLVGDWPMAMLGVDCYVMAVPAPARASRESVAQIVDTLTKDARVEWVQEMGVFHAQQSSDPLYPVQPGGKAWHLAEIHSVSTGRNIRVAVIDSGIEDTHPDLQGQVQLKENFIDGNPYVPESHGTAVAGIIAARAGNGVGIAGVAPDAKLMALRACWENPGKTAECNSFTLGKALNFAILHNAQIINLSLSGPPDRLLQRLVDAALSRGIIVIGAVDPHVKGGGFPASYPGVVAVSDDAAKAATAQVLIAPGRDIPTTVPGAKWRFVSGPSYAAAHVSGMMALLLELHPGRTSHIREGIVLTAADGNDSGAALLSSIDVCATVANQAGKCLCLCSSAHALKVNHNP
ncbi:S8 family peptidase [Undibacterium terreum]|uniref:Serine protease n=1 Tax=Undibacterium terreum TaxID=1224302 RepID=A0A916XR34_9BURK|nr:S8 family serine peptidase [Undibacterium terreum]GGD02015.1 serine protease [Undibacterium terreum]